MVESFSIDQLSLHIAESVITFPRGTTPPNDFAIPTPFDEIEFANPPQTLFLMKSLAAIDLNELADVGSTCMVKLVNGIVLPAPKYNVYPVLNLDPNTLIPKEELVIVSRWGLVSRGGKRPLWQAVIFQFNRYYE